MDDRYLLISSDGHAGPPAELYREYLDPRYHAQFDAHQEQQSVLRAGSRNEKFRAEWEARTGGDGGLTAAYDSAARNELLDREGVAAEVLFPDADVLGTGLLASSPFGSGLGSSGDSDPELVMAGARAHNRWLAGFCQQAPRRRVGVAVVPILHDIDAAIEEIRDVHALGLRGVMMPTRWMREPACHDPRYEPVWSTLEELGMVLHTHSGAGPADYGLGPGMMAIYATEAYWWAARPFWVLIWSGVFERHPGLKYVVAENGAWWVPDIIMKMDEKWHGGHNTKKLGNAFREAISKPPSHYLEHNVFIAASTPGVEDIERRHAVGIRNFMCGSDFPHPEGTFPYTREFVRLRFKDVPDDECRRIFALNAIDVYGLDGDALASIAARIGPRVDEVHRDEPLELIPS